MALPSHNDINVHDSLDERSACEHFLNKTIEQAETLFHENFLYYQEDLMWMGPIAFRYYIQAAINYIQSEAATGDSAIVSSVASLLEFRLRHEAVELEPVAQKLDGVCNYFLDHYQKFDLAPDLDSEVPNTVSLVKECVFENERDGWLA